MYPDSIIITIKLFFIFLSTTALLKKISIKYPKYCRRFNSDDKQSDVNRKAELVSFINRQELH